MPFLFEMVVVCVALDYCELDDPVNWILKNFWRGIASLC